MNNSNRLLDLYMQKLSLETLNEAARKLNVTRPAVSNWKAGTSHPNAEVIAIMCKSTGENPAHWLPLIEADRARTIGDRNAWLKLAQAAAALAVVYLVTRHGIDSDAVSAFVLSPVYIMRNQELDPRAMDHGSQATACRVSDGKPIRKAPQETHRGFSFRA